MKQGAVTLLEKPYEEDELWDAVREALDRDAVSRKQHQASEEFRRRLESLTGKERETMELVIGGKTNKLIARELGVSIRTVESRRHNIFEKLEVHSVAELVQAVIEAGGRLP